jgi:5-methylcytosine-specific restriction enzyme B
MGARLLEPRLFNELKEAVDRGLASGELMTPAQIAEQTGFFRERFGPAVLDGLDGEALLRLMHGRRDSDSKCLMHWLEFKNDDEFAGHSFGGIGGGAAMKYGIYQRQSDGAWMGGSPTRPHVLSLEDAIAKARQQRDELVAGSRVLAGLDAADTADETYARLQAAMMEAAPELTGDGWSHKYWFLIYPDRLDDFHSPRYQRFHLFKLLQMPPDGAGILDFSAPRFVCAGRFLSAARKLGVSVTALDGALNRRNPFHRYWRVGTTHGDTGESEWDAMRHGGFVSIGYRDWVGDLSKIIGQATARDQICDWLLRRYSTAPGAASRIAGQILRFTQDVAENDLILACEGQNVRGVGRIHGRYEYDSNLSFPHKRPVEWLTLERWQMPGQEGLQNIVWELGRNASNLLELERRRQLGPTIVEPGPVTGEEPPTPLPPLDPLSERIDHILRRKAQVVLYGPPGTGKTYHALRVAKELAARHAFRKTFARITEVERREVDGPGGLVRLCTFHPGYGYEDFVEGLRPRTVDGQMVFEPRDGIFKQLCTDAASQPGRQFFLVVDEINRGDVPRIFGELITVIEQDKRDTAVRLPLTSSPFAVPRNVFVVGTMNTADRSISLLDTALRRRFGFVELMPDSAQLVGRYAGELPLGPWLDALNARLRRHLKRDGRNLQIGHAYLLPPQPITSMAEFSRILRDDIIPLIEEYCYDDFVTLKEILGPELVDVENGRIRDEMFLPSREQDLILALSFEQMQPIVLDQGLAAAGPATEEPDAADDDAQADVADAAS